LSCRPSLTEKTRCEFTRGEKEEKKREQREQENKENKENKERSVDI